MSGDLGTKSSTPDAFLQWFDWALRVLWWLLRAICWWIVWRPAAHILLICLWLGSAVWLLAGFSGQAHLVSTTVLCAIPPILLWPFLRTSYFLYTRSSRPLTQDWRILEEDIRSEFPVTEMSDLSHSGFEFVGCLARSGLSGDFSVRTTLFTHLQNKDSARLSRIGKNAAPKQTIVFHTEFDDGFSFETTRSIRGAGILSPDPQSPVFRFPQVSSVVDLYGLHCAIKKGIASRRSPVLQDGKSELSRFVLDSEKTHMRYASHALKLSAAGHEYKYTLKAAVRLAWLHTWPVLQFRELLLRQNSLSKIRELGFRIDSMTGRLGGT